MRGVQTQIITSAELFERSNDPRIGFPMGMSSMLGEPFEHNQGQSLAITSSESVLHDIFERPADSEYFLGRVNRRCNDPQILFSMGMSSIIGEPFQHNQGLS